VLEQNVLPTNNGKGDGAAAAGAAMAAPLFGPIFFFNQLVNKLLCWVKQ